MTTPHTLRTRPAGLDALERPMLDAEHERLLIALAKKGDRRASGELVGAHLRLVRALARRHARVVSEDILAEGVLGLLESIDRFDIERGVRFATYASHWIRARIQQFVLANRCIVGSPDTRACRRVYGQLGRARRVLGTQTSDPGAEELAREIGVAATDVERVLAAQGRDVSIDTTHEQAMAPQSTGGSSPEERYAYAELADARHRVIEGVLAELPARERSVVEARALAEDSETLEQLAGKLTLSRERVRQLEVRALRRIGDALAHQGLAA